MFPLMVYPAELLFSIKCIHIALFPVAVYLWLITSIDLLYRFSFFNYILNIEKLFWLVAYSNTLCCWLVFWYFTNIVLVCWLFLLFMSVIYLRLDHPWKILLIAFSSIHLEIDYYILLLIILFLPCFSSFS